MTLKKLQVQPKPVKTQQDLANLVIGDIIEFVPHPESPLGIAMLDGREPSLNPGDYFFVMRDSLSPERTYALIAESKDLMPTSSGRIEFRGDIQAQLKLLDRESESTGSYDLINKMLRERGY